jgi:phosphohistidine phosphatase
MKTLYLLRHAKSSWDDSTLPDRDRPLAARGELDAMRMSKRWSLRYGGPDLILSSPPVRALATAKLIAKGFEYRLRDIKVDDRLYAASVDDLLAVVKALDGNVARALLVGHNPGFTELAHHFDSAITHMPTCALAEFRFDAKSWAAIGQAKTLRTTFDSPKQSSA